MSNYFLIITMLVFWIMSHNSRSKYVKKTKSDVVSNHVGQKYDVDLAILHVLLSILQSDIFVHVILQIESKVDFLLYSEYVVVLVVLLWATLHLFVDLLLSTLVTTTLMWFIYVVVTANLMWSKSAPIVAALMLD